VHDIVLKSVVQCTVVQGLYISHMKKYMAGTFYLIFYCLMHKSVLKLIRHLACCDC